MPQARTLLRLVLGIALLASLVPATAALAAPVGCDGAATPDGKVFPEPINSISYVTFADFECGMATLDGEFGARMEITSLGVSEGGHNIYDILLTDEQVDDEKEHLFIMSSIHGNEFGAREGAVRMIEEMVDPDLNGTDEVVEEVLDRFIIHWVFSNPDGWVNGEPTTNEGQGFQYTRANTNGNDLNRNFPVHGYFAYEDPEYFQSEGDAVAELFREHAGNWNLGTDNHGQLADGYLAAGLQIVGEFDYQKSETLAAFADGISAAMGEYLSTAAFYDVEQEFGEYLGAYHWGTLYDILGYSASGSGIDYFNTPGEVDGIGFATELSYANQQGATEHSYVAALNQIWTDSVRAINYTMFRQAIAPVEYTYELAGDVAYVFDPRRIRHDDDNGVGNDIGDPGNFGQAPYDVSRMKFFADLDANADHPVTPLEVAAIAGGDVDLNAYDSLILNETAIPEPIEDEEAYWAVLVDWVEQGGNLVLTDGALQSLPNLVDGIVADDIQLTSSYVGSVESFSDRSHPLNAGLRGVASQTFDTVPIGMSFGGANNVAPNWEIDTLSWEAAGGYSAGTHSPTHTVHGEIPLGDGRIGILGALLPDPVEDHYHPFGLQNYAVTYTGYTLLQNHLNWSNPNQQPVVIGDPAPEPDEGDVAGEDAPTSAAPLPATGGGLPLGLVLAGAAAALVPRRRSRSAA